jgi:hypothetical protein
VQGRLCNEHIDRGKESRHGHEIVTLKRQFEDEKVGLTKDFEAEIEKMTSDGKGQQLELMLSNLQRSV